MNEWSPGGNYSRPGTPNQSGRSFRSQREEADKVTKPLIVNIRAVSDNKVRSVQPHSLEDVTKSSLSVNCKKDVNGGSDPRFKRVISNGLQNDACVGTDNSKSSTKKSLKISEVGENKSQKCFTYTMSTETKSKQVVWNPVETPKGKELSPDEPEGNEILTQMDCDTYGQSHPLKAVDKLMFSHDIIVTSLPKESFSNCTVNTVNTSLVSDELLDDLANDLSMTPSATRVRKVQNWMQDQKLAPGKKQSLITVIGQTQDQDPLCSALQDIDKRRKLVKELDKYAICKKIIDTDKGKEVSDLMDKITSVPPSGKLKEVGEIKCAGESDMANHDPLYRDCGGDATKKHQDKTPANGTSSSSFIEKIEEKVSSHNNVGSSDYISPATQKRSSYKRKSKKNHLINDFPVKGNIQYYLNHVQYQRLFLVIFLISGILCWIVFTSLHSCSYVSFDFFSKKPKAITWYEKLCMWLWELFRPASNYKRNTSWSSY